MTATTEQEINSAFQNLSGAFPLLARYQGLHFKYAVKNGVILIETRRGGRYYYWLLVGERFRLIHSAEHSKWRKMKTVTHSTFTPTAQYDCGPDA